MRKITLVLSLLLLFAGAKSQILNLIHQGNTPVGGGLETWGYVDDSTGKEYALIGWWDSMYIYDVSTPSAPVLVASLDTIPGFDMKVYDHFIYTCSGNTNRPTYIIDIDNPASPQLVGTIQGTHNLWVDDNAHLYAAYPGLTIYDLANPATPSVIWHDSTTDGHDMMVQGNILYYFGGYAGMYIYDISNISSPQLLEQISDPNIKYTHSGWPSPDGKYLFICDELAKDPTPDITLWDLSSPGNPLKVNQYGDPQAIVHNLYILNGYAYVSYYQKGLKIFDVSGLPAFPLLTRYETFPDSSTENYGGDFGVYPFTPSGTIYASDMTYGLILFNFDSLTIGRDHELGMNPSVSLKTWPNPLQNVLNLQLDLENQDVVNFRVLDQRGREVVNLGNNSCLPGKNSFSFSLQNNLAPGTYFLIATGKFGQEVWKLVRE
ncbi:MAG: choice-of-anchor B family protein [Bacteroidia bacterium]|nr:choice-of-anchor B family protein [Bacteroidia bacterium]